MTKFPLSTFLAAATFAGILLGVHYGLTPARGLDPASLRPALHFRFDRASFVPVAPRPLPGVPETLAVPKPNLSNFNADSAANLTVESRFLFDQAGAMDHFYAALDDLASGGRDRPVRIVHYGDSPTTADLITGDARELLQDRFGDRRAGFCADRKAVGVVRSPRRGSFGDGMEDRYRGRVDARGRVRAGRRELYRAGGGREHDPAGGPLRDFGRDRIHGAAGRREDRRVGRWRGGRFGRYRRG